VIGANYSELASWYSQVVSQFDGVAPAMVDVNVPYKGMTLAALYFETDRAPYVIKNARYGVVSGSSIAFEVPWREGTRIRTAGRSDLIRLLVPILTAPEVEVQGGELTVSKTDNYHWYLNVHLYVIPQAPMSVVIPFYKCEGSFTLATEASVALSGVALKPPYIGLPGSLGRGSTPDSHTIYHTQSELIIQGPGRANFSGTASTEHLPEGFEGSTVEIYMKFSPIHANRPIMLKVQLGWDPADTPGLGRWTL
jgi:hypothetical protein